MEPVFAYLAGLLTLINPCVLPVLPLVLASALAKDRRGPAALALGLSLSFVVAGLGLAYAGRTLGLTEDRVTQTGAALMIAFAVVLLLPVGLLPAQAGWASALAARADRAYGRLEGRGPAAMILAGTLLGLVWVPCVGPTLGGALALAATGQEPGRVLVIMLAFALGVSTVILALGYGAQNRIRARRDRLARIGPHARVLIGLLLLFTGLALWFHWFRAAEIWLLDRLPYWLQDLSVRF